MQASKPVLKYCCIHPACEEVYAQFQQLESHIKSKHPDHQDDLTGSKSRSARKQVKLARCFWVKSVDGQYERCQQATLAECDEFERSHRGRPTKKHKACQESTEEVTDKSASEATAYLPQDQTQRKLLQTALTTVALYLAPPGTPQEDLLHSAKSFLHNLRVQKADILAPSDSSSRYCSTCNIRMEVAAWQDLKTKQWQCILCHEANMKRVTLLSRLHCKLLDDLLQQAGSDDLLPVPCTEQQVLDHLGNADRPNTSCFGPHIDFLDVPALLGCMGEDLKKQKDDNDWDFVSGDDGEGVIELNTANIMHAILVDGVYFQCNLHVPESTSSVPKDICRVVELRRTLASIEELWEQAEAIQIPSHSTLWLIGSKGCGTGFHVDWSEAYNITWRLDRKVPLESPLAVWVFLHPAVLSKAEAWLKKIKGFRRGFRQNAEKATVLKLDQMYQLKKAMGVDRTGQAYVQLVRQFHGSVVHVPAGWAHCVLNLEACAKLAWEVYREEHLLNYVLSWQYIARQFTRERNAPDYMAVVGVALQVIVHRMPRWKA